MRSPLETYHILTFIRTWRALPLLSAKVLRNEYADRLNTANTIILYQPLPPHILSHMLTRHVPRIVYSV